MKAPQLTADNGAAGKVIENKPLVWTIRWLDKKPTPNYIIYEWIKNWKK